MAVKVPTAIPSSNVEVIQVEEDMEFPIVTDGGITEPVPSAILSSNVEVINVEEDMEFPIVTDGNGITEPGKHDVLCGRGGNINNHKGNENFRKLIEAHKRSYLTARFKRDKRIITDSIIDEVQKRGGKFLTRDFIKGLWYEVSQDKARDKTSQALRENAPKIREEIEKENEAVRQAMRREEDAAYPPSQYYRQSPERVTHFNDDYNNGVHHHVSPMEQNHAVYINELDDGRTEWGNSPKQSSYYQNHSATHISTPYSNAETPRYNNTKSFMETIAEAFVCPTSLGDIYSHTKPYNKSSDQHQIQSDNASHYNGNQRTYYTSYNNYQRRDDREPTNDRDHRPSRCYQKRSSSPIYYRLPDEPTSPYSQQPNPKRKKGPRDYTAMYTQQPVQEHSNRLNPISLNSFPFSWRSEETKKSYVQPIPSDEGQEVQLVSGVESMSMDCDYQNDMFPYDENQDDMNYSYKTNPEIRTPPPVDDHTDSDDYWTSKVGGCHNFFFTNMFGFENEEAHKDQVEETTIKKIPSLDLDGSLLSLEDPEQISGDLNGASLVNVFSEGSNPDETKDNSVKAPAEESCSISLGDSILAVDSADLLKQMIIM